MVDPKDPEPAGAPGDAREKPLSEAQDITIVMLEVISTRVLNVPMGTFNPASTPLGQVPSAAPTRRRVLLRGGAKRCVPGNASAGMSTASRADVARIPFFSR